MKIRPFLFTVTTLLFITGCSHVNTDKDYYYKENINLNGIDVEFYGKGYGSYGQLLPRYCTGSIDSIFNAESTLTIQTSAPDNDLASANEIYITLTYPALTKINKLYTKFLIEDKKLVSSFKISYKGKEDSETTITSSYKEEGTYTISNEVTSISLYVRLNKYYSTYYEIEELRDKLARTPFTIVQFLPN